MSEKKSIIGKLGITKTPWKFDVRPKGKHCYLSGRNGDIVMDFRRWGMQNAQPFFQRDGLIHPVETFLEPVPGEEHHTWVKQINHPDAKIIESAPEMLEELADSILMIEQYEQSHIYQNGIGTGDENVIRYHHKIEAIEKACHPLKWPEIKEIISGE